MKPKDVFIKLAADILAVVIMFSCYRYLSSHIMLDGKNLPRFSFLEVLCMVGILRGLKVLRILP